MVNSDAKFDLQQARTLIGQGQWRSVIEQLQPHLNNKTNNSEIWYLASLAFLNLGNQSTALKAARQALALASDKLDYALQMLRCMAVLGRWSSVSLELDKISLRDNLSAQQYDSVGTIYSLCEQHIKARDCFIKATQLQNDNPHYFYNLATALRFTGDFDGCIEACEKTIKLNPLDGQAFLLRSEVRKQSVGLNNIPELERALKNLQRSTQTSPPQEVALGFSLAKEYDDVSDYKTSFNYLKQASDLRRSQFDYSVDNDISLMTNLVDTHSKQWLDSRTKPVAHVRPKGMSGPSPIFILGLPRSGTSLLERMLSAHSDVSSAGEINDFSKALAASIKQQGLSQKKSNKSDAISQSVDLNMSDLGLRYMQLCSEKIRKTPRFIDKTPVNYLYAGLIRAALPEAKIIILDRNPMDVCFAMYRANFSQAYPFSYKLSELAKYYLAYQKLREHWLQVLGPAGMHKVRYEDLVENPRDQLVKVLGFCDLAWQDQCLDFQNQPQAATTASAYQVRQPIYKSSVSKWKHYRHEIAEIENIFTQNGLRVEDQAILKTQGADLNWKSPALK